MDFLKPVMHFFIFNLIPFISCLSPDVDNVCALKTSAITSHTILAHTPSTTCWSYQNSKKKIITNLSSRTHFSSTKTNLFCSYISLLYKVHSTAVFLFTSLSIFYTHFYQNLEKTAKKPKNSVTRASYLYSIIFFIKILRWCGKKLAGKCVYKFSGADDYLVS